MKYCHEINNIHKSFIYKDVQNYSLHFIHVTVYADRVLVAAVSASETLRYFHLHFSLVC